jgi:hypothetical protein
MSASIHIQGSHGAQTAYRDVPTMCAHSVRASFPRFLQTRPIPLHQPPRKIYTARTRHLLVTATSTPKPLEGPVSSKVVRHASQVEGLDVGAEVELNCHGLAFGGCVASCRIFIVDVSMVESYVFPA